MRASGRFIDRVFHVEHRDRVGGPTVRARLRRFVELLLRWNRVINLVGRNDEAEIWRRHVDDALQLVELLPANVERGIDIGSGAGFPGLVLAIATGIEWELIEADHRKANFLREAARETGAPVRVHAVRAEVATLPPASVVTARGFGPLTRMLPVCLPLLRPDGVCILPKGQGAEQELTDAGRQWHMRANVVRSRTASDSAILLLSQIRPAH